MGSNRLPGKILKPIGGRELLGHILFRLSFLHHQLPLVIATSTRSLDDRVEAFCRVAEVDCFRGSEQDVLERYYHCACSYGWQHIVRLTGDNPFVDVVELDRLIDFHLQGKFGYSHSFAELPVGTGAEIFSFDALERSFREGLKSNHREHVNEYIQENPQLFQIASLGVGAPKREPGVRLTVDTLEDYRKACFIVEHTLEKYVGTEEAICFSDQFERASGWRKEYC